MKVRVQILVGGKLLTNEVIPRYKSVWQALNEACQLGAYPFKIKEAILDKEGFLVYTTNDKTVIRVKEEISLDYAGRRIG